MSLPETTPLLSEQRELPTYAEARQAHDHGHISVRACHSAWPWLSQRALVLLRGGVFAYLTAVVPVLFRYKVAEKSAADLTSWSALFDFSMLTHVLQWLWHAVGLLWGLMHHRHSAAEEDELRRIFANTLLSLSQPAPSQTSSPSHFYYSLLYTAAHVFNFMNMVMYWAVLAPQGYGTLPSGGHGEEMAGHGWLRTFSIANMYGITPLIASIEVLFLNTITHDHIVLSQVLSTLFLLVGYLGWAAVGNTMTGEYPFFWMDPRLMGSAKLVAACAAGFVGLGAAAFAAMYSLTAVRDKLAEYVSPRAQYSPLPDSGGEHEPAVDADDPSLGGRV